MKDFFYGGIHKKRKGSDWLDEYEEELAIQQAKNLPKISAEKRRARLAELIAMDTSLTQEFITLDTDKDNFTGIPDKYIRYFAKTIDNAPITLYLDPSLSQKNEKTLTRGQRLLNVRKKGNYYSIDALVDGKIVSGFLKEENVLDTTNQTITLSASFNHEQNIKEGDPDGIAAIAYLEQTLKIETEEAKEYYESIKKSRNNNFWSNFSEAKSNNGNISFRVELELSTYLERLEEFHGSYAVDALMQNLSFTSKDKNTISTESNAKALDRIIGGVKDMTIDIQLFFNSIYPKFLHVVGLWYQFLDENPPYNTQYYSSKPWIYKPKTKDKDEVQNFQSKWGCIEGDKKLKYQELNSFLERNVGNLGNLSDSINSKNIAENLVEEELKYIAKSNSQIDKDKIITLLLDSYHATQIDALEPLIFSNLNNTTTSASVNYQKMAIAQRDDAYVMAKEVLGENTYLQWIEASKSALYLSINQGNPDTHLANLKEFYRIFRLSAIGSDDPGFAKYAVEDKHKTYFVQNPLFSNDEFKKRLEELGYNLQGYYTQQTDSKYVGRNELEALKGLTPKNKVDSKNYHNIAQSFFELEHDFIRLIMQEARKSNNLSKQKKESAERLGYFTAAASRIDRLLDRPGITRIPVIFIPETNIHQTRLDQPQGAEEQVKNSFTFEWYAYQEDNLWVLNTPNDKIFKASSIEEAIGKFVESEQESYPKGLLYYQITKGDTKYINSIKIAPTGKWSFSTWLRMIGTGTMLVGAIFTPGGQVSVPIIIGSLLNIAGATLEIADDIDKAHLTPASLMINLLDIASSIVGMSTVLKVSRLVNVANKADIALDLALMLKLDTAINTATIVVYTVEVQRMLQEIDKSNLDPDQKKELFIKMLLFYVGSSALTVYSLKTNTNDIKNLGGLKQLPNQSETVKPEKPFDVNIIHINAPEKNHIARIDENLNMEINMPRLISHAKNNNIPVDVLMNDIKLEEFGHIWIEILDRVDDKIIKSLYKDIEANPNFNKIKEEYSLIAQKAAQRAQKELGDDVVDVNSYIQTYFAKEFLAKAIKGEISVPRNFLEKIWDEIRKFLELIGIQIGKNKNLNELSLNDLVQSARKDLKDPVAYNDQQELVAFLKGDKDKLIFNDKSPLYRQNIEGKPLVLHDWYATDFFSDNEYYHKLMKLIKNFKYSEADKKLSKSDKQLLDKIEEDLNLYKESIEDVSFAKLKKEDIYDKVQKFKELIDKEGKKLQKLGERATQSGIKEAEALKMFHTSKYVKNIDEIDITHPDFNYKGSEFGRFVRTKLYTPKGWDTQVRNWETNLLKTDYGKGGIQDPTDAKRFISTDPDEVNHLQKSGGIVKNINGQTVYSIPKLVKGRKNYEIDHKIPVAEHWELGANGSIGNDTDQLTRETWYQDINNLRIISQSLNASLGSGGITYSNKVGSNFKGPGE
jgi:hypothetical protein